MKIIFFGSSEFAVPSLERILDSGHEVMAVVTQPDREKGRDLEIQATPVKNFASSRKVPIYQPENLRDHSVQERLKGLSADLFVVVAYGKILPRELLDIPGFYAINLHASLLPKYRGAAPIARAIMSGEKETGLTIIRMNEKMDEGDVVLQRKVGIEGADTSEALSQRLSRLGAILLIDAIRFIEEERISFKKQNERKATLAPILKKEDGLIDWNKDASEIHNKVRGTIPWPGAYTYFDSKKINIWKTSVLDGSGAPGEVIETGKELLVGAKKGLLKIEEIQIEGKRRMESAEFLRGYRNLEKGSKFSV